MDFVRIEHGGRGDYIEFNPSQIVWKNLYIPETEIKRIGNNYYYLEYRTRDKCNVKIYHQKRVVDYANYKIGFLYASPKGLTKEKNTLLNIVGGVLFK